MQSGLNIEVFFMSYLRDCSLDLNILLLLLRVRDGLVIGAQIQDVLIDDARLDLRDKTLKH